MAPPPPLGDAVAVVPSVGLEAIPKQVCKMELTTTKDAPRSTPYYVVDSDDDMSSTVVDPDSPRPTDLEEPPQVKETTKSTSTNGAPAVISKALAVGPVPKPSVKPTQKMEVPVPEPVAETGEGAEAKASQGEVSKTSLPSHQPQPEPPSGTPESTKPIEPAIAPAPTPPQPTPPPTLPPQEPLSLPTPPPTSAVVAKAPAPEPPVSNTPEDTTRSPVKPPAKKPDDDEMEAEMDDDEKYIRGRYEKVRDDDLTKYVKKAKAHPLLQTYVCVNTLA